MDASSLQKGVAAGTITIEQVLELLLQQVEEHRQLREENRRLTARVEMLEARLAPRDESS